MKAVLKLTPGRTFAIRSDADGLDSLLEMVTGAPIEWEAVETGDRDALWCPVALAFEGQTKTGEAFCLFDYWGPATPELYNEHPDLFDMGQALERYPSAQAVRDDEGVRDRAGLLSNWVAPWAVPLGEGVRDAAKSLRKWALGGLGVAAVVGLAVVLSSRRRRR